MPADKHILIKVAEEACAKVMEHADSAQIFLTQYDPETGQTRHITIGMGNWYAREGQIREWVLQNDENSRMEVHSEDEE